MADLDDNKKCISGGPLVSVCIPAYENAEGVKRLLESVMIQTYTNLEIIVTDDSQNDAVEQTVKSMMPLFEKKGMNAAYFRNRPSVGAAQNWNKAISLSCGSYIKIMHHDDWFTDKNSLACLVKLLEDDPKADLAFCGTYQVSLMKGRPGKAKARHISDEDRELIEKDWRNLFLGNTIGAPSAVIVRNKKGAGAAYDPQLTWLVDSDYYMQILSQNPHMAADRRPLISIGLSETQLTEKVGNDPFVLTKEYSYVFRKFSLEKYPVYRKKLCDVLVRNGVSSKEIKDSAKVTSAAVIGSRLSYGYEKAGLLLGTCDHIYHKVMNRVQERMAKPLGILFYLALLVEILIVIIDKSALSNPYTSLIEKVTFFMFALVMMGTAYTRKDILYILTGIVLGILVWRCGGHEDILRIVIFMAACVHMDLKKVLKFMLWTTFAGCIVLVLLSVTGLFGTLSLTQDFGTGITTRWCLGLGHPNALHCMAAMLAILAMYVYDKKMRLYLYLIFIVGDILLYSLTDSAMGLIVWGGCALFSALIHYDKRLRNMDRLFVCLEAFLLIGIIAPFAGAVIDPADSVVLSKIDRLLTGRMATLWDFTFHDGTLSTWHLFGSRLNDVYFDLGFVRVTYWYGTLTAVITIAAIIIMERKLRERKDLAAWNLVFWCSVYTIFEAHLVSEYIGRNFVLIAAVMALSDTINISGTTAKGSRSGVES